MPLLQYLANHFFTLEQLLEYSQLSLSDFRDWQQQQLMPKASYTLDVAITCQSFFGEHQQTEQQEYYAKGYASWLGIIVSLPDKTSIYQIFKQRYQRTIAQLKQQGHVSDADKMNQGLAQHIKQEWQYFLDGTYGLCTLSGLPEDIAKKEFAIVQIKELIEFDSLTEQQLIQLKNAVDLLDQSSSAFAPHERANSSRFRLVDEVRRKYQLSANR